MRRVWSWCWAASLLLLVGCEADTGLLGDASGVDSGLPGDAGIGGDSGVDGDAGQPTDAAVTDGGTPVCGMGRSFSLDVDGWSVDPLEGPVVVEGVDPLVLRSLISDRTVTVFLSGEVPQGWTWVGDTLYVMLEVERPWWVEARLTAWALDPADGPAELRLVAWSGSRYGQGVIDPVRYGYEAGACQLTGDGCGPQRSESLRVVAGAETLTADWGERAEAGALTILNGRSARYVDGPFCSDTPSEWYAGWLAYRPPLTGDCASMQRDACIADSRCVLWGSEVADPSYLCRPAQTPCESLGADDCRVDPTCRWDPGDCYCPEDVDCDCGGGPAPKCRDLCGGFLGTGCGPGYYCDLDHFSAPACLQPGDADGVCERLPEACRGTPNGPVCACTLSTPPGPTSFENDCLRRQAQASGAIPGTCM
ncbi:MAG: hypothetical protein KC933_27865 [Myxococcales bacterium]|nr:hypothetical protein [Myxococcales bacterium]